MFDFYIKTKLGITNHMAFKLPIEKFGLGTFLPFKGKCLEDTRAKWKKIKWLIIDEMSMISYEVFRQINLRCQKIKESEENFGGLNLVLVTGFLINLIYLFMKLIYGNCLNWNN
jgi:hypothetical protein